MKTLFHGTDSQSAKDICERGIDLSIGADYVDFGPGFKKGSGEIKDYTQDDLRRNKNLREMVERGNQTYIADSAKIRLYAPDNIYNEYSLLLPEARFAFADQYGPRLIENSKWAYDAWITILAGEMLEDLGYRSYSEGQTMIKCPECTTKHDIYSECPKCHMTFQDYRARIIKAIQTQQEYLMEEQEKTTSEDQNIDASTQEEAEKPAQDNNTEKIDKGVAK